MLIHRLPARYVSGYLETLSPPGQDKPIGADASHAWFAVYHPGLGWFDFDPTNNHCPDNRHITVAWGRDYGDVTPLKGVVYGGGQPQTTVSVEVINRRGDRPPYPIAIGFRPAQSKEGTRRTTRPSLDARVPPGRRTGGLKGGNGRACRTRAVVSPRSGAMPIGSPQQRAPSSIHFMAIVASLRQGQDLPSRAPSSTRLRIGLCPSAGRSALHHGLPAQTAGARVLAFVSPQSPDSHPEPGRAQPKRPSRPHADHPITDRPVRRNSTGCKTALNVLSFTR